MKQTPWWTKQGKPHPGFKKGNANPNWNENVSHHGIHFYIKRRKPKPELCEICRIKSAYDLTNISDTYKRDLDDWEWTCRSCHMLKDGRMAKLPTYWKGRKHTEKVKKEMSRTRKGRKHTDKAKEKIREAKLKQWRDGVYANRKNVV